MSHAAAVIGEVLRRVPSLRCADVDDVMVGCAMPEAEQGLNVARIASLRAGGTESMSLVPMGGNKVCPNPTLV
jgi:acetyl-CoA acyltransferase